jgi:vancomycin resistance protein YoaR
LWPRRKVYLDNLPKTHDLRFGVVFVVGLLVIFGGLYAVGYAVAGNKLPAGTTIAAVDVGGLTPDEARTVLQDRLAPRVQRPIKATAAGEDFTFQPQRAGLTFDIDATIDKALGGSPWDPRHMLHVLTGGDDLAPVVDVDNHELAARLRQVAEKIELKPVESVVSFRSGRPVVAPGHAGRSLDYQLSGDRLIAALVAGDDQTTLPIKAVQPDVTAIEATRFAETVGRRAVSGPVRIKVADDALTLQPATFATALRAVSRSDGLRLDVDEDRLYERVKPALRRLPHHPVNARIRFRGDRPVVVPATSGVTVTPDDLAKAVLAAAGRPSGERVARAHVQADTPRVSTHDVRMLRVTGIVAAAQLRIRPAVGGTDPTDALRRLNGELIRPGSTFSFLAAVRDGRTPAASTVATLTYNAAFFAGLDIPERTSARIYTADFPPGMDAAVEPPVTDLVLRNSTPYGVYVRAYVDSPGGRGSPVRVARVEIWSTRYWRVSARSSGRYSVVPPDVVTNSQRGCVPRAGAAGFDVDVTRLLRRDGHRRSEVTHTSYAPLDQVRCTARSRP